jgi:hypothetical protein
MATTRRAAEGRRRTTKVPNSYRLPPSKLAAAQRILGAATETEAIETALDMVVFRQELIDGTAAMAGIEIASPDED